MVLPIVAYGDPVLKKVGKEIEKNLKTLPELIQNMFDTMYNSSGVGLAAPQIGQSLRLFVIDAAPFEDKEPELKNFRKVFINAKIVNEEGEMWKFNEGCLSIPGIREDVERNPKVRIQYYDENFKFFDEVYEGIAARIIQHEYDHIEGKLFIDHLSPLKKRLLKRKLTDISKGIVDVDYKMKFPLR
jgi:peptide deformylase